MAVLRMSSGATRIRYKPFQELRLKKLSFGGEMRHSPGGWMVIAFRAPKSSHGLQSPVGFGKS